MGRRGEGQGGNWAKEVKGKEATEATCHMVAGGRRVESQSGLGRRRGASGRQGGALGAASGK